jgi:hypothetical protein
LYRAWKTRKRKSLLTPRKKPTQKVRRTAMTFVKADAVGADAGGGADEGAGAKGKNTLRSASRIGASIMPGRHTNLRAKMRLTTSARSPHPVRRTSNIEDATRRMARGAGAVADGAAAVATGAIVARSASRYGTTPSGRRRRKKKWTKPMPLLRTAIRSGQ